MKQQRAAPAALDDADAIVCEPLGHAPDDETRCTIAAARVHYQHQNSTARAPRRDIGCCGLAAAALNIVRHLWPPARVTVVYAFTAPNSQTRSLPHHHETNAETSALPCLGPWWLNGRANLKFLNALATSSYSALVNLLK